MSIITNEAQPTEQFNLKSAYKVLSGNDHSAFYIKKDKAKQKPFKELVKGKSMEEVIVIGLDYLEEINSTEALDMI